MLLKIKANKTIQKCPLNFIYFYNHFNFILDENIREDSSIFILSSHILHFMTSHFIYIKLNYFLFKLLIISKIIFDILRINFYICFLRISIEIYFSNYKHLI